jgi:hypothetical protein
METKEQIPRIFLGTGYVMGLVPSAATPGDVLVRFWNCNTAIVMRPINTKPTSFMLVGQADLAELTDRTCSELFAFPYISYATFDSQPLPAGETQTSQMSGAVFVDLNLRTLQKITAHTTTHTHDTARR